jgi:hypothetical protein
MKNVRFVGLDVHAQTIAVAEAGSEVRSLGVIPNSPEAVNRLIKKLGKPGQLRVCYEAGPVGARGPPPHVPAPRDERRLGARIRAAPAGRLQIAKESPLGAVLAKC